MRASFLLPPVLLAVPLALAGCGKPGRVTIDDGYVRLSAVPRRPAAAYFTIHGGPADTVLIAVSSAVAIRTEMHESMMSGGMASMKPLDHLAIPAGRAVKFAPGGRHVMIYDLNPGITAGKTMILRFTFADGKRIEYAPMVVTAGAPAPH